MADPSPTLVEILLTSGRVLALQLNEKLSVRVVHNAPLLVELRGSSAALPATLLSLLEELLPSPHAGEILRQINAAAPTADEDGVPLGTSVLRVLPGGGPDRFVTMSLHRVEDSNTMPLLLLIRDATSVEALQHTLARARQSLEAALCVLRAPAQAIRQFLTGAMAAVGGLRSTMKLPARDQEAAHAKLVRLHGDTEQLGAAATEAGIETIARACAALADRVGILRDQPHVSGDEMLSLAPLLDQLASSIGDCLRIEEERHIESDTAQAAAASTGASAGREKEAKAWARSAQRGWNSFIRRLGEELGTLVKLQVQDAEAVPPALRRDVDLMLQHLLRNAVEHGLETPEQRLAADKPVSGEIVIRFRDLGPQGMSMSVRDDGRGFDVERIGRAAVRSGLLSEESLLEYDPGEIVGLIFKPTFSTENLEGEAGRGRGMNYLRRAVARLGGRITVATKPGTYTRFVIQLPADAAAVADKR